MGVDVRSDRGAVPTLAQIRGWDIDHLTSAADAWTNTAQLWEDAVDDLVHPGACADRRRVRSLADELRSASRVASCGASELAGAKACVVQAIDKARTAGFRVREDLSVTDRFVCRSRAFQAVRQAEAQRHCATIRRTAAVLAALDEDVAAKLTTVSAALRSATTILQE